MAHDVVLATLNARYAHASFGLRYLLANMGELRARTALLEFDIKRSCDEVVARILAESPQIVGLGVYIWNVTELTSVVRELKARRPDLAVILGGPEVSYEPESQEIVRLADFVISGEADLAFADLARRLLSGERPKEKLIEASLPPLEKIASPYREYTEEDLAHRVVYVEASRGCPFSCEFCLSALDIPVRAFPLEGFLAEMQALLDRGARNFKFVDRTFNLSAKTSAAILAFFLERMRPGLHVHFELVPDRLPQGVRELLARFPEGSIQLEIGVQTFTPGVNAAVSRFQDDAKVESNLRFLRDETRVHVHADLIFGLPGETLETFGASVDRLLPLVPGDIQIGILKRLRGTPIVRHELAGRLVFSPDPPYEVVSTDTVSPQEMQRIQRFSRYFDTFRNGKEHRRALALLADGAASPFRALLDFSDWLHEKTGRTHDLPLMKRCEWLFDFLTSIERIDAKRAAKATIEDYYGRVPRSEPLSFLDPHVDARALRELQKRNRALAHSREPARHLQVTTSFPPLLPPRTRGEDGRGAVEAL